MPKTLYKPKRRLGLTLNFMLCSSTVFFSGPLVGLGFRKKNHTEERTAAQERTKHGDGNGKVKTI